MCKQTPLPLIIDLQPTQKEQGWSKTVEITFIHVRARNTGCNKPYKGEF